MSCFSLQGYLFFLLLSYVGGQTTSRTLDNFCTALHGKDYQSMYDQLSNKLQALGSVKLIAENLSNVQGCTYAISKESEKITVAELTFAGKSSQHISGTIILIKDSNNTWKIDDLQNI